MENQNGSRDYLSCRFCGSKLEHTFVDLGMSPPCETYLTAEGINKMERFYPLRAYVCDRCFLVQLGEYVSPEEIFTEYAYFSSYVDALVKQAEKYTAMIINRLKLDSRSRVVEIASNDGYLLQFFVDKGIPAIGIEPAANVAQESKKKGIDTRVDFFTERLARKMVDEGQAADLIIGNNVLSQVPDLKGFIRGMKILLKDRGVITVEFPHIVRLVEDNLFDTIYHEHFSYFSFTTIETIFAGHGLRIFDVEDLPVHGGSLRIFACHAEDLTKQNDLRIYERLRNEESWGVKELSTYRGFADRVRRSKREILKFLINANESGKSVVGYGAPGKATTLLNYCGIRTDLIQFTVDRNPYKHGKFTAGTHIPIFQPDRIQEARPDYLFVLPWNLKEEVAEQNSFIRNWGGRFVVPLPNFEVF